MSYGFFRFVDAMLALLAAVTLPAAVLVVLTYFFRKTDRNIDA